MKTFAEILKENIDKDFIYKLKPKKLTILEKEIKDFFVNNDDIKKIHGSRLFYSKLFKYPVESVFYWCEEDWYGSIFVIYKYLDNFIYSDGYFGSCEICENYTKDNDSLDNIFNNFKIVTNLDDITFTHFTNKNLKISFENFKKELKENQNSITLEDKVEDKVEVKSWVDIVINKK